MKYMVKLKVAELFQETTDKGYRQLSNLCLLHQMKYQEGWGEYKGDDVKDILLEAIVDKIGEIRNIGLTLSLWQGHFESGSGILSFYFKIKSSSPLAVPMIVGKAYMEVFQRKDTLEL